MNDRFRFRVWSDLDKKFVPFCIEDLETGPGCGYFTEQCTGFKDENGKLIYEGDIVRVFYDFFNGVFTEKEVVGPVVWKCGNWVVNGWFLNCAPEYDETHLESSAVEVIGNIHENPEMLEADNGGKN